MSKSLIAIAGFLALYGQCGACQDENVQLTTLRQYIASMHWDPAKSGPLIAVEVDRTVCKEARPAGLSSFRQKLVRSGGLSVICLDWTVALDESELPNAYQFLTNQEKLIFLLATLGPNDLAKLTGKGISAGELSREQSAALLSMIPNPLKIIKGEADGSGFSSNSEATLFPPDQVENIRLQFQKGIDVMYGATLTNDGQKSASIVSSLNFGGPSGTPLVRSNQIYDPSDPKPILGQVVDSVDKKSDIAWSDPRLKEVIELKNSITVGLLVDTIREKTGIEVYADQRISALTLTICGVHASARDLLHGVALSVGGVLRAVGPALVLTANLEGQATQDTRIQVRKAIGRSAIFGELVQWKAAVAKRGLLTKLGYAQDDPFSAESIAAADFAPETSSWEASWVPVSHLPSALQEAVRQASGNGVDHSNGSKPDPTLSGFVKVSPTFGYRFVLPDGRPLESRALEKETLQVESGSSAPADSSFPVDPKSLLPGSAVGIKSDDPEVVSKLCGMIKAGNVKEVWLDTESQLAIRAVANTGLTVDLVIHPWKVLRGENCPDPDRNVLGQTGDRLNEVAGVRLDPVTHRTSTFATSFSPASAGLASHWEKLMGLVQSEKIHRVVLLDSEPGGYQAASEAGGWSNLSDGDTDYGLKANVPDVAEFGFSNALRLRFLREHRMDPIDLIVSSGKRLSPMLPYFDNLGGIGNMTNPFSGVEYPEFGGEMPNNIQQDWSTTRHTRADAKLADFVAKLTANSKSVLVERRGELMGLDAVMPTRWVTSRDQAEKDTKIQLLSVNPLSTEDDHGVLTWKPYIDAKLPLTLDLSEIPIERMPVYLHYIFKLPAQSSANDLARN